MNISRIGFINSVAASIAFAFLPNGATANINSDGSFQLVEFFDDRIVRNKNAATYDDVVGMAAKEIKEIITFPAECRRRYTIVLFDHDSLSIWVVYNKGYSAGSEVLRNTRNKIIEDIQKIVEADE